MAVSALKSSLHAQFFRCRTVAGTALALNLALCRSVSPAVHLFLRMRPFARFGGGFCRFHEGFVGKGNSFAARKAVFFAVARHIAVALSIVRMRAFPCRNATRRLLRPTVLGGQVLIGADSVDVFVHMASMGGNGGEKE